MNLPIILASASPARLQLLRQIGLIPDFVIPSDIDESERDGELPRQLAHRLSFEKAAFVAATIEQGIIIGADTIPLVGRRIMRKAVTSEDVRLSLKLLSQRRHSVYTGVCVIKKTSTETIKLIKVVKSIVKFKHLSDTEIEYFCSLTKASATLVATLLLAMLNHSFLIFLVRSQILLVFLFVKQSIC